MLDFRSITIRDKTKILHSRDLLEKHIWVQQFLQTSAILV